MKISIKLRKKCGIYSIINTINGKRYIGSSNDIYNRLHTHLSKLRNNTSHNRHLQNSWNKYGEDEFMYNILEFCLESEQFDKEQDYLDFINPEYNFSKQVIVNIGRVISEEQKEKISNTLKKKYKSNEINTYKQEHAWIKCYVYNINNFTLVSECKNINAALKVVNSRNATKNKLETTIYNKQYCISKTKYNSFIQIKNYVCENLLHRITSLGTKEYLISENNSGELFYYKTIVDCANATESSRSTLNKHKNATKDNPYIVKKSNHKVYFSLNYISYEEPSIEGIL